VKPELFVHGALYDAEAETGLPLRLSFIALFTCCDREGRFKWRPRELKLACLPHDEVDFSRVLDALTTRGFVVRYASDYGCIPSWNRHQVINNREGASLLPMPTETDIVTREARVEHATTTPAKGKGREGKGIGKEGNPSKDGERKMLFSNSKWMVIDMVKEALPEMDSEGVDLTHYRDAIQNWSDTKDEKRSERGWLATFRQWTKTDRDKGQLKKLQTASTGWNPRA